MELKKRIQETVGVDITALAKKVAEAFDRRGGQADLAADIRTAIYSYLTCYDPEDYFRWESDEPVEIRWEPHQEMGQRTLGDIELLRQLKERLESGKN